jgi:hypothetical protein
VSIFERISKRKRVLIPVALACGFCIILVSYGLAALTSSRKTGMIGSFIELGEHNGKKITWQIINNENGVYTLLAVEPVTKGSFSESVPSNTVPEKYGSNIWVNSKIRAYLNGDFLKCFSDEELALFVSVKHKVLLSSGNISLKETGNQELFWSHIPVLSDRDYDNSYAINVYDMVSLPEEEAQKRFGFLLEAFKYGTPPHGGLAFGLDRLIMLMANRNSIRDVIAFPKVQNASCLMTGAPDSVEIKQLRELHIRTLEAD